jgi:hypothetical protein
MMIDLSERFASVAHVARFFEYGHLTNAELAAISKHCSDLAEVMLRILPDGPELTAGLRKLLEAKDCFVRAGLIAHG